MADDRKNIDEEYQYADVDLAKEVEQEPPLEDELRSPARQRDIKGLLKKVLIPVVVIAAIYVVYQFIGPDQSQDAKTTDFASQTTTMAPATSSTLDSNIAVSLAKSDLALQSDVTRLKQTQSQHTANLRSLTASVSALSTKVVGMNATLGSMQSSLTSINNKLAEKTAVVKKTTRQTTKRAYVPRAPRITYTLKALVPGRAWLQASNGNTVAVKVGDKLGGFGTVTAINPTQGWVATSSGRYIRYGSGDA